MPPEAEKKEASGFFSLTNNPLKFRLFLLSKLPAAFFSSVRIKEADEVHCTVTVPFKWLTQNPFKSTYFACLGMAAEMSTGVLAMAHIYKKHPAVSMLIVSNEARYLKKAIGTTTFTCKDGLLIKSAIHKAIESGEPQVVTVITDGTNKKGELIAQASFTWSFKVK